MDSVIQGIYVQSQGQVPEFESWLHVSNLENRSQYTELHSFARSVMKL